MAAGHRSTYRLLAASVVLAALAGAPAPAAAQGFFESLFGAFGSPPPRTAPRIAIPAYAPPGYSRDERFPIPEFAPRAERPIVISRGGGAHCVRLCDGRYFPLPRSAGGARLDPVKVCNALCPAAKTQVFNGGNMQYAAAADGTRYADLDTAFLFRDKVVPDCSCTGNGPGGLAQIDVESDPTLRAGDIVVTAAGPTVFRGSNAFPYRSADFTPVDDYSRLNRALRDKLSGLQVDPSATPALPPQRIAAGGAAEKPARSRTRRSRVQASEIRGALRIYPEFRLR